ncbi:MAG: hypothetical protein HC881_13430 [Leptolyngbyaceae cyanobacterium SL_7_1]|nr:hypothetical protein [Leptolyngbyaceae cyanobacterium SL_7_1]
MISLPLLHQSAQVDSAAAIEFRTPLNVLTELREMVRDAVQCHFEEAEQSRLIQMFYLD